MDGEAHVKDFPPYFASRKGGGTMVREFFRPKITCGLVQFDQIRQINWGKIIQATKRQNRRLENNPLLDRQPMKVLDMIRNSIVSTHTDN